MSSSESVHFIVKSIIDFKNILRKTLTSFFHQTQCHDSIVSHFNLGLKPISGPSGLTVIDSENVRR